MKKRLINQPLFIPLLVLGLVVSGIASLLIYQAMTTKQPTEAEKAQAAAITEARKVADAYLQAQMTCDLLHINELRETPISDEEFSKCNVQKQAGYTAQAGSVISYERLYDASLKMNVETAVFLPVITKTGQPQPGANLLMLQRYPDKDNIWKVFK